ncbi:hypothetical protein C8J56DRAFT_1115429 [Mycena floridula]|nr:hypothetical protein C8J56DRAFT_1115429 [Mycena floridula]
MWNTSPLKSEIRLSYLTKLDLSFFNSDWTASPLTGPSLISSLILPALEDLVAYSNSLASIIYMLEKSTCRLKGLKLTQMDDIDQGLLARLFRVLPCLETLDLTWVRDPLATCLDNVNATGALPALRTVKFHPHVITDDSCFTSIQEFITLRNNPASGTIASLKDIRFDRHVHMTQMEQAKWNIRSAKLKDEDLRISIKTCF